MTEPFDYTAEAAHVVALLKKSFLRPDGSLILERSEKRVRTEHIFPDLGDTLPFLLYFGEKEFAAQQVRAYRDVLQAGVLVSQFPTLRLSGLVKSYEYTDLVLGLTAFYEAEPSAERMQVLDGTLKAMEAAFTHRTAPRSFFWPRFAIQLPVIDTRDATLIECYTTLAHSLNDDGYLVPARMLFNALTATPFYQTHGLFADYEPTSALARFVLGRDRHTQSATLCKNSTNALFAFLDLYRATGEDRHLNTTVALARTVLTKARTRSGGIAERFVPDAALGPACLTASFPVLDFLCDLAMTEPAHRAWALKEARALADFWITQQGATGLFPLYEGGRETFIDSETDMIVALYKLFEASKDDKYLAAAEQCFEGFYKYHGAEDYPLVVDVATGAVVNPTQRTKFLCLSLKLLILKLEYAKGNRIYRDAHLFELLKDR